MVLLNLCISHSHLVWADARRGLQRHGMVAEAWLQGSRDWVDHFCVGGELPIIRKADYRSQRSILR